MLFPSAILYVCNTKKNEFKTHTEREFSKDESSSSKGPRKVRGCVWRERDILCNSTPLNLEET